MKKMKKYQEEKEEEKEEKIKKRRRRKRKKKKKRWITKTKSQEGTQCQRINCIFTCHMMCPLERIISSDPPLFWPQPHGQF